MKSMKAVRIHAYGGRDVLAYEDAPMPEARQDEVLVRVAASSVNPFDWAARSGYVAEYYPYAFPLTLGLDVSGVINLWDRQPTVSISGTQSMAGRIQPRMAPMQNISPYLPRRLPISRALWTSSRRVPYPT